MFREDYKLAYKEIRVKEALKQKMLLEADEDTAHRKKAWMRVVAMAATIILCLCVAVPVGASNIPAFYQIIECISPKLADKLVPIEKECSQNGIIVSMEAINVEENQAEVIVSVGDEEGYDRIHGEVDLFDSYGLKSLTGENNIGGCQFLRYDEAEDKAYFKVTLQTEGAFDKSKLVFTVNTILCEKTVEEREINIAEYILPDENYGIKTVSVSGLSHDDDFGEKVGLYGLKESFLNDPRPQYKVLALDYEGIISQDELVITGIVYENNLLRIQSCQGDGTKEDRHVRWQLFNENEEEVEGFASVGWHEEIGGERYDFTEEWFEGPIENLEECRLVGTFFASEGGVEGNWKIVFEVE